MDQNEEISSYVHADIEIVCIKRSTYDLFEVCLDKITCLFQI